MYPSEHEHQEHGKRGEDCLGPTAANASPVEETANTQTISASEERQPKLQSRHLDRGREQSSYKKTDVSARRRHSDGKRKKHEAAHSFAHRVWIAQSTTLGASRRWRPERAELDRRAAVRTRYRWTQEPHAVPPLPPLGNCSPVDVRRVTPCRSILARGNSSQSWGLRSIVSLSIEESSARPSLESSRGAAAVNSQGASPCG